MTALKAGPKTPPVEKQIAILEASKKTPPRIMALWDRGGPSPTYIYRRGNYLTPGAFVTPGAPAVLCDPARPFTIQPPYPGAKSTGRRLALARWLVHPDQPLTARVMVNRLWKHHYGAGIVRSLGNFGKTGDPPTHPELLDFLAREFIRQGWSVKALQRKMLLAGVYRQRSAVSPESAAGDPPNRLLSRINLRRLEAEVLRDTLLLAAGELDETPFGPAEPVQVRPDGMVVSGKRRSVYVQQLRKHPPSLLESFDLPTMNPNCLQRDNSLVATQALYLQNDAAIRNLAEKCAEQVLLAVGDDSARQIQQSYRRILGRAPLPEELAACQEKLTELKQAWTAEPQSAGKLTPPEAARRALATVCHAVMNSASFLYVD